jgi:hypothetical protein
MVFEVRGIGIAKPLSEPVANNNKSIAKPNSRADAEPVANNNKSIAKPNSRADTGSRCINKSAITGCLGHWNLPELVRREWQAYH